MSLPRLVGLAVALFILLTATAASGETLLKSCGDGVRAAIVDCGKAKRLVREHLKTNRRSVWMYSCRSGEKRGRCVLDRKIITFRVD